MSIWLRRSFHIYFANSLSVNIWAFELWFLSNCVRSYQIINYQTSTSFTSKHRTMPASRRDHDNDISIFYFTFIENRPPTWASTRPRSHWSRACQSPKLWVRRHVLSDQPQKDPDRTKNIKGSMNKNQKPDLMGATMSRLTWAFNHVIHGLKSGRSRWTFGQPNGLTTVTFCLLK